MRAQFLERNAPKAPRSVTTELLSLNGAESRTACSVCLVSYNHARNDSDGISTRVCDVRSQAFDVL